MRAIVPPAILAFVLSACSWDDDRPAGEERPVEDAEVYFDTPAASRATADIGPVGGSSVEGTVRLVDVGEGVRVIALVRGLEPAGDHFHGLQILTATDCAAVDESSPHFDPDGAPHGPFDAGRGARHAGDLGNIRAYDGAGRYDRVEPLLDLEGPRSPVGRAVVVRADRDDAWSRDGLAGAIVGCGVLEPANAQAAGGTARPT